MKAIVTAIVLLILVTGCSDTTSKNVATDLPPVQVEAPEPTPEPTALSSAQQEVVYLSVVRGLVPELANASDSDLVALGRQGCTTIDAIMYDFDPQTSDEFFTAMAVVAIGQGITEAEMERMALVMGIAVPVYCPHYEEFLSS